MALSADPATVIRAQHVLEEHDVAPDASFVVVSRREVAGDRYVSHLWLVPLRGRGRARRLTDGPVRDSRPRVSPDGRALAFRRATSPPPGRPSKGEATRLHVLPLDPPTRHRTKRSGGRPAKPWVVRTPKGRSVGELAWAPDGRRIAFTLETDPPRFLIGDEPRGDGSPLGRRITRIDWRWDEAGHVDRWEHLFVVDARRGAAPRQLTEGDHGVSGIAWAPDGSRIAFVADPRPDADLEPRPSIWTVVVGTPEAVDDAGPRPRPVEVLALGGRAEAPAWSPDGRWIAAVGVPNADDLDDVSPALVVGPADGSRPPVLVAPDLDRPIGAWVDTDLQWAADQRTAPAWADERTILAIVSDRASALPWRFAIDPATGAGTGRPSPLASGEGSAWSLAVAAGRDRPVHERVTLLACVGSAPVEVATPDPDPAGPLRVRSSIGSAWARGLAWPVMRRVAAPGAGGPIDTWIASPGGASDGPLPTVVDVHGGPLGAWTSAPSLEVVLLCARGYRVVLPNIRGSQTYGRSWIRPQLGDWGGVDAADVHAALDHAVALGLADPDRLGAIGLSYGGFMVNWLVGTSDRFRAAVSENGVTNQVGAWANSDSGVDYNAKSLLGAPLDHDGMERLWRQSPLSNVANIRTPLLMLQAEADRRCPAADNEQLFVALRVLRRTVEYVLYPDEFHVYQATGRPDRRIDRMTRMLDWFDRYLKG